MSFRERVLRFLSFGLAESNSLSFSFGPVAGTTTTAEDEEVNGLNFRTAIEAHQKWKTRLTDYLANRSNETLDALIIARDDQCVLGKWIHSIGQQSYGHVPRFTELRQTHAAFHQSASEIVSLFQSGRAAQAIAALENGTYSQHSLKVCKLLAQLYLELQPK